jgi:aspartyl-tRNA(Asn)/glutamyl-tRNA(Gln) amidotransferase subunit A
MVCDLVLQQRKPSLEETYKLSRSQGFGKEVQRRIMSGTFVLSAGYYDAYYSKAQKVRRIVAEKTQKTLTDYDFIICPTAPTPAYKIGEVSRFHNIFFR